MRPRRSRRRAAGNGAAAGKSGGNCPASVRFYFKPFASSAASFCIRSTSRIWSIASFAL